MLAVQAANARFNIVIVLSQIDEEVRIICRWIIISIALAVTIDERRPVVQLRFCVSK